MSRPAASGSAARRAVLPLLAAALVVLASPGEVSTARALVDPATQVPGGATVAQATLTAVEPASATAQDVITLRGVLRNTSSSELTEPLPALRWSADPVQTSDELDLVAENPLFRYGQVDYRYSQRLATLGPGQQVDFAVEVPLSRLGLGSGVYVIGVDVLATLPDGPRVFVASARTTVPIDVDVEQPLPVATLWPVAASPSLLIDGRHLDDDLADQIGPDGRLERLVRTATDAPVTWVVDPDLVDGVASMVGGYQTVDPPASGAGAADAAGFLALLSTAIGPGADVVAVPAADPDVGGMLASGLDEAGVAAIVEDSVADSAVTDLLGRTVRPVAWLADRAVDEATVRAYAEAGVASVVLSAAAVEPTPEASRVPLDLDAGDGRGRLSAVLPDDLPLVGSDPAVVDDVEVRQRFLAQTALLASAGSPGVVVAPPLRWAPEPTVPGAVLGAWQGTPWVQPVPLERLALADEPVELADGEPVPALDPRLTDTLGQLAQDVERLQPLFVEPPVSAAELPRSTARVTSAAWAALPDRGERYAAALQSSVATAERQIELRLSDSITLSSRSGRFPITLVNNADDDVVVGVDFRSQNTSRLRVEPIEPIVLTAGEKRTVTATALASANGRVQVSASLVTTQGEPVGTAAVTSVDVTNVGALGWTVIALGGVLLAVALLRSRLRRRAAGPDAGAGEAAPRDERLQDRVR